MVFNNLHQLLGFLIEEGIISPDEPVFYTPMSTPVSLLRSAVEKEKESEVEHDTAVAVGPMLDRLDVRQHTPTSSPLSSNPDLTAVSQSPTLVDSPKTSVDLLTSRVRTSVI